MNNSIEEEAAAQVKGTEDIFIKSQRKISQYKVDAYESTKSLQNTKYTEPEEKLLMTLNNQGSKSIEVRKDNK